MPVVGHTTTINWNQLNTTTERVLRPRLKDQIFNSNAFFKRVPKSTEDGGTWLAEPLLYDEGPGAPYSGTDPLDSSEVEMITNAIFPWKFYYASAAMRNQDLLMNRGSKGLIKIIKVKMETMRKTMQNLLGQGLWSNGTSDTNAVTGIRAMITGTGTTYGGISKTTNSWWRSPIDTSTTTLTLPVMRTRVGSVTQDEERTDLILTTQAIFDIFWGLMEPQRRYMDGKMQSAGFTNLMFEQTPVVVDSHAAAAHMAFLNTKYMNFVSHSAENMRIRGWMEPIDRPQLRTNYLMWAGNLLGSNCRYQTMLTAITA